MGASGTIGGGPVTTLPGTTSGIGYTSNGAGTATLTFTPSGDGLPGSGATTMTINTLSPDGSPLSVNVPVSNETDTEVQVPYGVDAPGAGAGEIQISQLPAFGADGSTFPTMPVAIPGVQQMSELNNAVQTHALLTSKTFLVTARYNKKKNNDSEPKCDAKCQAAKKAAMDHAAQQLGNSFGTGP